MTQIRRTQVTRIKKNQISSSDIMYFVYVMGKSAVRAKRAREKEEKAQRRRRGK